jgi:glycosyltransferase involved in cell wall biosynthesis
VQNKVLEAMAMDLPVVCSPRVLAGLAEGGFRHGRDLLAAADPAAFASCLGDLLADPAPRQRLAAAARQRLAGAYRWGAHLERFERLVTRTETAGIFGACQSA